MVEAAYNADVDWFLYTSSVGVYHPAEVFVEGNIRTKIKPSNDDSDNNDVKTIVFTPKSMYYGKQRTFEKFTFANSPKSSTNVINRLKTDFKYFNEFLRLRFLLILIIPYLVGIMMLTISGDINDSTEIFVAAFSLVFLFIGLFLTSDYFDHISNKDEIIALIQNTKNLKHR